MIKTEQLRYLLELDKTNSFHKCAENLYLSQPAISLSIRNLEKELGVTLFERTPAGVFPTEIGKKVITLARTIMHSLNDIYIICDDSQLDSGAVQLEELNIYAPEAFTSNIMPSVLPNMQKRFPTTRFSLHGHDLDTALKHISENLYDICFYYIYNKDRDIILNQYPDIQFDTLCEIQFSLTMSKTAEFLPTGPIYLEKPYTNDPVPLVSFNKSVPIAFQIEQKMIDNNIGQLILDSPVISLMHSYIYQGLGAFLTVSLGKDKPLTSIDHSRVTFVPLETECKASLVLFSNQNIPEEIRLILLHHLHSYLNFM